MRILIIAPTPFFADRGCHVRILGEAKALQGLGHVIKVCTYHIGKDIDGIETVRIPSIPWYRKLSAGPSVHKFYIDLLLLWNVLKTCRTFQPDLIHAHLHEGIVIGKLACMLYRVPMVADLQGSLTEELLDHRFIPRWRWLIRTVRWIERRVDEMPHHLIASSTSTAQLVRERFGFERNEVTAIGDGVDLDVFYPRPQDPSLQAALGIAPQDKVVVFIGVLTRYQGIDILLDAIGRVRREIRHAKFLFIGYPEAPYREKARAMGLEECTIFVGKVPYAEAPKYLALGSIAVSPKMSATEANLKLFTYMAMGLPTVVFESPVNREILGDLGVYADYGDVTSLARSLGDLLKDELRAKGLGKGSYQRASACYSWRAVGSRLLESYRLHCVGSLH